jgi:hypothetical protein
MLPYLRSIGFSMVAIYKIFHKPQSIVLAGVSLSTMSFDKEIKLGVLRNCTQKHAIALSAERKFRSTL